MQPCQRQALGIPGAGRAVGEVCGQVPGARLGRGLGGAAGIRPGIGPCRQRAVQIGGGRLGPQGRQVHGLEGGAGLLQRLRGPGPNGGLGRGAHGFTHTGVANKDREQYHGNGADQQNQKVAGAHDVVDVLKKSHFRQQVGERHEVRRLREQHIVLQKDGHTNGRNERRQARRTAQRLVGYLFKRVAIGRAPDNGRQRSDNKYAASRKAIDAKRASYEQGCERAQHIYFAMGKVDEPDDAINQCVAKSDERINAASGQATTKELYKKLNVHANSRAVRA